MRYYLICILSLIIFQSVWLSGCSSSQVRGSQANSVRNQQLAAQLTDQAVRVLVENPQQAEKLLREALSADLYYGPAHNNLGVLYLQREELYEAAEEFDWARKLMPGHPDPRINLGIALEQGGKIEDALEAYSSALEVYPNHLPAVQALVRCQVRHGYEDQGTVELLNQIIFRGDAEWKAWALRIMNTN